MDHEEVAYCAQGVMPSRANACEVLCHNPTVYYGKDKDRPNCNTCGHQGKKVMYLIPVRNHIQVVSIAQICPLTESPSPPNAPHSPLPPLLTTSRHVLP